MSARITRTGTAQDAAKVLGVSLSTFHRSRAAATLVVDHKLGGVLRELTPSEAGDRAWAKRQHLVAPALFGQQLPRRQWVFDLFRLERQMQSGPPAGEWDGRGD